MKTSKKNLFYILAYMFFLVSCDDMYTACGRGDSVRPPHPSTECLEKDPITVTPTVHLTVTNRKTEEPIASISVMLKLQYINGYYSAEDQKCLTFVENEEQFTHTTNAAGVVEFSGSSFEMDNSLDAVLSRVEVIHMDYATNHILRNTKYGNSQDLQLSLRLLRNDQVNDN